MTFGIIGYGNLGKALASALIGTGEVKADEIHICDSSGQALSHAEEEHFHIHYANAVNDLIAEVEVICLVLKSHVFEEIAEKINTGALRGKTVISFMAGVSMSKLATLLNIEKDNPYSIWLARAMPSLAIAKNDGVIACTKIPEKITSIFKKFGYAFETRSDNIERVTAFSACGLGFASYLIDAYKTAGEKMGFPSGEAAHIAAITFKNACEKALVDEPDPGCFRETVKAVATPGGATEQGINHMDECDVYGIVSDAMKKAYNLVK